MNFFTTSPELILINRLQVTEKALFLAESWFVRSEKGFLDGLMLKSKNSKNMDIQKAFVSALTVVGIIPLVFLSSCKKEVNCLGLPQQMEGYFPSVSELKFSNGIGDTLILPVEDYSRSIPRTLTNNPLSVGGTGSKPVCYETIEAWSSMSIPVYWSFKLTVSEDSKTTKINFTITEEFISTNSFSKAVNETPSTLGDYKVFGDTLVMSVSQSVTRFTEAQIVYGQGLVKLHDVVNNCDWTRVW